MKPKQLSKTAWVILGLSVPIVISLALGGASLINFGQLVAGSHSSGRSSSARELVQKVFKGETTPDSIYDRVWRLIKQDYYDTTYNGQNWSRWQHRYEGKLTSFDDSHKAIETMLASLGDRYTRFLDREAFDDEKTQIDAHFYGIGVQIGLDRSQRIIVIAPIEGTPASKAGLMPNDEIAAINGKSTKGMSVDEAAKQIKGPLNSKVVLTLVRANKHLKAEIIRAQIPVKAVQTAKMIDGNIGYIRLSSFISEQATAEVRDALAKLSKAKGLILDLRHNPGGLLTNAIDISNMFLRSGNIVSTVDRDGYKTPAMCDGRPICDLPMVILIDDGSASAAEITSGALRDNGRAILVGQKSFGKGLVQGINRLDDGSGVNVTIARYLTPNDTDIHKKGIVPDVQISLKEKDYLAGRGPWWLDLQDPAKAHSPEEKRDVQLNKALEIIKTKIGQSKTDHSVARGI
ncbi:MAG: S41 family peptidase [Candidatus Obscuribacterales bacterium]|nr:S41 family peptidase [Candidatus Obscuribacterales bacterium]